MPDVPCSHHDGTGCTLGNYGGRPADLTCMTRCPEYDGPDRGAGDLVKRTLERASGGRIKPCGGCQKRRAALNRLLPARR